MRFFFTFLIICIGLAGNGQDNLTLSFWSDVMINSNDPENRMIAFDQFYRGLETELEKDNAFDYDFAGLEELSILEDTLSTFKLISWQMDLGENEFSYYGFLIKNDGTYFELKDEFASLDDIEYLELNSEEWLGGIYYGMLEMGDKYYLFSYRQKDQFTKFKSFDCLSFDNDGKPVLGSESFVIPMADTRDIVKNRIVFNYSADAILSLNYNKDLSMVVHDHLMQINGQIPGQGPAMVPDGTYEGYKFEEGKWIYESKLFHHTYDEAPRPQQILGKSKRDLFGKEKKN